MGNFEKDLKEGREMEIKVMEYYRKQGLAVGLAPEGMLVCDIVKLDGSPFVEVKYDRMSQETGNLAFEFHCRGKSSGIAATKAELWVEVLANGKAYEIEVEDLKTLLRYFRNKRGTVHGGDDNAAEMILVPLKDFLCFPIKEIEI